MFTVQYKTYSNGVFSSSVWTDLVRFKRQSDMLKFFNKHNEWTGDAAYGAMRLKK